MLYLFQQFPARQADELLPVNFAQNNAAIRALELGKNIFQKIDMYTSLYRFFS